MNAIQHPACNSKLLPPLGMTEDQCHTLHIYREQDEHGTYVSSFWIPEPTELDALNAGGSIWFRVMGDTHPPMKLLVSPHGEAGANSDSPPLANMVITQEVFDAIVKERDDAIAWRKNEFDSGDDGLFNIRRLRARVLELEAMNTAGKSGYVLSRDEYLAYLKTIKEESASEQETQSPYQIESLQNAAEEFAIALNKQGTIIPTDITRIQADTLRYAGLMINDMSRGTHSADRAEAIDEARDLLIEEAHTHHPSKD